MGVSFPIGASIVGFYGKASHLLLPMDLNRRFFCSPLAFTNTMRRIGSPFCTSMAKTWALLVSSELLVWKYVCLCVMYLYLLRMYVHARVYIHAYILLF